MRLSLSFSTFCRPNSLFAFSSLQHHVHIRHRTDYDEQKAVAVMGVRRGGKTGINPPGNWDYELKISGKLEISSLISINWFNSWNDSMYASMTYCTRVRFTVLLSCSDELAVQFCSLLCLQRQVEQLGADCSTSGLYYASITWQQNFKSSLQVLVAAGLPTWFLWSQILKFGFLLTCLAFF